MTKKTPIAQRRPFPIEYPRFWESKKTHRAASMGKKTKKIKKPPPREGLRVPGSKDSRAPSQETKEGVQGWQSNFSQAPSIP
jgi:hypothetical protein